VSKTPILNSKVKPKLAWTAFVASPAPDYINTLAVSRSGDIYAAGHTSYKTGITRGASLKLDGQGKPLAYYALEGPGENFNYALAPGLDDSYYQVGRCGVSPGWEWYGQQGYGEDAFISKINANGVNEWTRIIDYGGVEAATAIAVAADGSLFVCGNSDVHIFVSKFSSSGDLCWTQQLEGGMDYARDIAVATDGSIFICGEAGRGDSFEGMPISGTGKAFVSKLNADGSKAWTRLYGDSQYENATAITIGLDDSIYVGGVTLESSVSYDAFIAKIDTEGNQSWRSLLGCTDGAWL
jgi:hypothetical protein